MKKRRTAKNRKFTDSSFRQYMNASSSAATRLAYACDIAAFRKWGGQIPSSPTVIARYLAGHATELAYSTLVRRLAAISNAHRARGIESPTRAEMVRATMRGIRRTHRRQPRQAAPIMVGDLRKRVRTALGVRGIRDRALLLVGFAGGFRASEIVGLNVEDIEFVNSGALVHLRKSKTDQEGRGRVVALPFGKREQWSCPIRALRNWMKRAELRAGAIFRRVDRNGHACGERLSTQMVSLIVKKLVRALGKDPAGFSGHSLRAGFVTSAAAAGVPSWKIRQQTGHKSDQMMLRYVRPMKLFHKHALLSML